MLGACRSAPDLAAYGGRGLHGEVVEKIGMRIVTNDYPPGTLLFVENLERELGVSKTVVREALKVLGAKGLVESRPKRGTIVRPRAVWNLLDPDLLLWRGAEAEPGFLVDLSEVRFLVEPEAARLAAERRSQEDLERLEAAYSAMSAATEAGDPVAFIDADLAFHRALLAAVHNELLEQMQVVIEVGLRVRDQTVHRHERWPDPLPVHRAVLDAIRAGNSEEAAKNTCSMLKQSMEDVLSVRHSARARRRPAASNRQ